MKLVNRAKMTTATTGTGVITLGSAVDGYQTFSAAGVSDSDVIRYAIEDGANWEIGSGTYSAGTLTRSVSESSNGGAAISLSGEAVVFVTMAAADMVQQADIGVTVQGYDADIVSDASYVHTDNNYTTTEKNKLAGIEAGATTDQTASEILTAVKSVDGAASGLDADLLDGQHGTYYTGYTDTAIANLVDTAPATLDTLNELAAALGDDPNFATTVTNSIATKLNSSAYTAADVLAKVKTVDGAGSGLDADLLDGQHGSYYYPASNPNGYTTNTGTVTSVATGGGLTGGTITGSGTISHADTSSQASVNNSGATVIQDVTLDTYGHVTGLGSATLTASTVGALPISGGTLTGTLNYRFLQSQATSDYDTAGDASGFSVFYGTSSATNKPSGIDHAVATFSYSDAWQTQIAMDWRTKDAYFRTQENGTWKTWDKFWHSGNDGSGSGLDADLLDGQQGSYYYPASNPNGYTTNTGTVTSVATGGGLTGGTITGSGTISHADTSTQASVDNSGATFIQDVTLDTYGHVTAIGSATITPATIGAATAAQGALADSAVQPTDPLSAVGTKTTSYTISVGDVGGFVILGTGGSITVPNSTLSAGDIVSIFNNTTGDVMITVSTTAGYIAGTGASITSATLATRGIANVFFIDATTCVLTGNVS